MRQAVLGMGHLLLAQLDDGITALEANDAELAMRVERRQRLAPQNPST